MNNLKNKTIFITGASGGLAEAVIPLIKQAGANIIGADRNSGQLKNYKDKGLLKDYIVGDLTSSRIQNQIIQKFSKKTDILINNVGAGIVKSLEQTSRDDFLAQWKINFETAAILCKAFVPFMAQNGGGKIINVATVLADNPLPNMSAYVSSKAALIAFTRSVALEYATKNVQANVVAPGYIVVPKNRKNLKSKKGEHFCKAKIPMQKVAEPDDVAGAFLFLASSLSDHITGQVIKVDGGYSIW